MTPIYQCKEKTFKANKLHRRKHLTNYMQENTWDKENTAPCHNAQSEYNQTNFYIGQIQHLRKTVTLHRQQIDHKEYRHFKISNHIFNCSKGKLNMTPIYQCKDSNRLLLKLKKQHIIDILKLELNKLIIQTIIGNLIHVNN